MTAHETNLQSLRRGFQAQMADQRDIEARRFKTRATHRDQMRDVRRINVSILQRSLGCLLRQRRRVLGKILHSHGSRRPKRRRTVLLFSGGRIGQPLQSRGVRQHRVPVLDPRLSIQRRQHPLLLLGAANHRAGQLRRLLLRHGIWRHGQPDAANRHTHPW